MYGDMMYCEICGKPFMDTWRGYDTKTNNKLITNCPFCDSCYVLNASQFIEKYRQKAPNQHSNTTLYKHIKKLYLIYSLTWKAHYLPDIYLSTKERTNFNKQFLIGIASNACVTTEEMAAALSAMTCIPHHTFK